MRVVRVVRVVAPRTRRRIESSSSSGHGGIHNKTAHGSVSAMGAWSYRHSALMAWPGSIGSGLEGGMVAITELV